MSGAGVKVLSAEVLARLKGMEARGGNLTGVNRVFGSDMKGSIDKNFTAQGRPAPWAPLKPQSLNAWGYRYKKGSKYRTKKGYPTKAGRAAMGGRLVLVAKGLMRNSFYYLAGARSVLIGSNDPKIKFHVFGTKFMPARNPLLFQVEDIQRYETMLSTFVLTGRIG